MNQVKERLNKALARGFKTGSEFKSFEDEINKLYQELAALQVAHKLQNLVRETALQELVQVFLKSLCCNFRMVAWRPHSRLFLAGLRATIYLPYYARKCAPTKGLSPHMALLGLLQHMTPSRVAMLTAALSSLKEAAKILESWGIPIDMKTLRLVSKVFAQKARASKNLVLLR